MFLFCLHAANHIASPTNFHITLLISACITARALDSASWGEGIQFHRKPGCIDANAQKAIHLAQFYNVLYGGNKGQPLLITGQWVPTTSGSSRVTHSGNTSLLHSSPVLQEWLHNAAHCPHCPIPPTLSFFRNSKRRRCQGAVILSRTLPWAVCLPRSKKVPKTVSYKKGPWITIFPSATGLLN